MRESGIGILRFPTTGGGSMIVSLIGIKISPETPRFCRRMWNTVFRNSSLGLANLQRLVKLLLLKHVNEHLPWYWTLYMILLEKHPNFKRFIFLGTFLSAHRWFSWGISFSYSSSLTSSLWIQVAMTLSIAIQRNSNCFLEQRAINSVFTIVHTRAWMWRAALPCGSKIPKKCLWYSQESTAWS